MLHQNSLPAQGRSVSVSSLFILGDRHGGIEYANVKISLGIRDVFIFQFRYRPKGVFGKGVGNSKNASEMRQKCVKMGLVLFGEKRNVPKCVRNASKLRQTCVKNVRKVFGGERLLDDSGMVFLRAPVTGWLVQLKPGIMTEIRQLKRAPVRGADGHVRGADGPATRKGSLLSCTKLRPFLLRFSKFAWGL